MLYISGRGLCSEKQDLLPYTWPGHNFHIICIGPLAWNYRLRTWDAILAPLYKIPWKSAVRLIPILLETQTRKNTRAWRCHKGIFLRKEARWAWPYVIAIGRSVGIRPYVIAVGRYQTTVWYRPTEHIDIRSDTDQPTDRSDIAVGRSVSDRSLDDIGGFRDGDRKYENAKLAESCAVLLHVD